MASSADTAQLCCVFGFAAGSQHGGGGLRFETPHINVSSRPITVPPSQAQHHGLDSKHGRTLGCDWLLRQWESTDLSLEAVVSEATLMLLFSGWDYCSVLTSPGEKRTVD